MFSVYPSQLETSLYIRDDEEFRVHHSASRSMHFASISQ
jgi:hypothetical protein